MKTEKSKPLSSLIFILLLSLILLRPFFSGLAYPALEFYYQNCIIFLAIMVLLFNKKLLLENPYNLPLLLLLSAYLISTITSINIQNSVKEIIKFISYFCIFFLVSQTNDGQKRSLIKTIVISASIISLYSIYQYFWGYQHTLNYLKEINSDFLLTSSYARDILIAKRAIGTFPSPNILGSYLILVFFLSLYLVKSSSRRYLWCLTAFLIISALILTKSMGVWLSLTATFIMLFFLSYKSLKKKKLILISSFALIAFAITFILLTRWERLMDLENPQNSITQRLNYWRTAIAIIKDHPILGVGPGNFQEVFLEYRVGLSTDTRYAHNIFLHTWAETGVLGLISISYLIASFFKKCRRRSDSRFILLSGLAFILCNLIDNSYFIPQAGIFFWILLLL